MTTVVTVCVCTFKRPQLLGELLQSLGRQRTVGIEWSIVVVDNDATATAEPTVAPFAATLDVPLTYAVEVRRGISHARNTAVGHSRGDYVAFIDDDEVAAPDWLQNLVRTALAHQCDAVLGPVLPVFPEGAPAWVRDSGFFNRPRHVTGTHVRSQEGRTGNALVKQRWLMEAEPFRVELGLTGGEDYDFFRRLEAAGGSIVWADDALVSEIVPPERQRLRWMLERAVRGGLDYWRAQRRGGMPLVASWAQVALGLCIAFVFGTAALIVWPFSRAFAVKALVRSAKGLGRSLSMTEMRIETYGRG